MKVGLFIPCYVDAVFPEVGVATYKLNQTCCGQPMANAGFEKMAVPLAEKFELMFKGFDHVVAPSVSCTAFIKLNYPRLLKGRHECLTADMVMDVVEFLHDVLKVNQPLGKFEAKVLVTECANSVFRLHRSITSRSSIRLKTSSLSLRDSRLLSQSVPTSAAVLAECSLLRKPLSASRWVTRRLSAIRILVRNMSLVPTVLVSCTWQASLRNA